MVNKSRTHYDRYAERIFPQRRRRLIYIQSPLVLSAPVVRRQPTATDDDEWLTDWLAGRFACLLAHCPAGSLNLAI